MQSLRLAEERLDGFLNALRDEGELYAPVAREVQSGKAQGTEVFALERIEDPRRARPDALRTILPFKKLLLPPRVTVTRGDARGWRDGDDEPIAPMIFYGAHACDVHALKILDLLFLSDFPDPSYRRRREKLTVIGYGCMPDEKCFCQSLGTATVDDGFDLFFTPLRGRYLVTIGSARGDDLVRRHAVGFEPASRGDTQEYLARLKERTASFSLSLDTHDLPYVLELKKGDPVWEELGRKCLCCGSCSIVCPTCTCFNLWDQMPSEGCSERLRCWDACLYRDYAVVAGGHNFRERRADRVRNRYYHKQEAFVREFGMPSCVGCGRCIENCPTGIHVVEVFQHVRGEA